MLSYQPVIEFYNVHAQPKKQNSVLADADYDIALYRWRYAEGRLQRVERLKTLTELHAKDMKISPDDRYLWIMREEGYIVDLKAQATYRVTKVERHADGSYSAEYFEAIFSPDSRYLMGFELGNKRGLTLFAVPSGRRIPITEEGDFDGGWYPDSQAVWFRERGKTGAVYRFDVRTRRISRLGAAAAKRIDEEWEMLNPSFRRGLPRDQYVYAPNGKVRAGVYPPPATEELRTRRPTFYVQWQDGHSTTVAHSWDEINLKAVSNDGRYVLAYCGKKKGIKGSLQIFDIRKRSEQTVGLSTDMELVAMLSAIKIWFA